MHKIVGLFTRDQKIQISAQYPLLDNSITSFTTEQIRQLFASLLFGSDSKETTAAMDAYSKDLAILNGLASSRRLATEGGQHDTAAVLDVHIMKLEKEMNDAVAEMGNAIPPREDGSPWWFGKEEYVDLTWWWKETAAMHRLQERAEHRKEASLNALVKTIDKNYDEIEKKIHDQPDDDLMQMSDTMVQYMKHETAPNAIEQLNIYLADRQSDERINLRIMKELDLVLRWKEKAATEDVGIESIDTKTLYPTQREILVEDALRALRDYRQALLSYGSECEDKAVFELVSTTLHREDSLPKLASATPEYKGGSKDSCSCGDECIIASLPPLPSPPVTPDMSIDDEQIIERLKQFDSELRDWSTYLQQELRSYRHFLSTRGESNPDVLKTTKDIIALAKGKGKSDQQDFDVLNSSGCTGSCQETAIEEGDANIDNKELKISKFNGERFRPLPGDLQVFYETVSKNIHRAEVDRQLLTAAQMLVETVGESLEGKVDGRENIIEAVKENSAAMQEPEPEIKGSLSKNATEAGTSAPDLVEQAKEIEKATLEVKGNLDSELVVASEKITTLMKQSAGAGNQAQDDPKILDEADKLVKLAKEEIENPPKDMTAEPEPVKKEKRRKTVRFAHKLVEILGEMKPSSSKKSPIKMSESTSQLEKEITTLTSQVKTLEVEISSNPQPRTVCHPCGPRWISLSPYKRATGFFYQWDRETEELIVALLTELEKMMQDEDIMSDSQISHLELDASATTEKTEEKVDMLDNSRCRTLGALRCYHFNLGMGTLVTGEKVDEGVERALQTVMALSEGVGDDLRSSESMKASGTSDQGELSDEERLVSIVEWYMNQVRSHGVAPTQDIVNAARRILYWATEHGTTDDEEEHRKAMAWTHWWRWT
ncbi:hypothetical protein DL98DRAFT_639732 [Cadophora sp. DSE1049]|nr:hypothetical protein DL98DRAFT_639732 [Cadophora sp. DSE1049]